MTATPLSGDSTAPDESLKMRVVDAGLGDCAGPRPINVFTHATRANTSLARYHARHADSDPHSWVRRRTSGTIDGVPTPPESTKSSLRLKLGSWSTALPRASTAMLGLGCPERWLTVAPS